MRRQALPIAPAHGAADGQRGPRPCCRRSRRPLPTRLAHPTRHLNRGVDGYLFSRIQVTGYLSRIGDGHLYRISVDFLPGMSRSGDTNPG
jgi:hypothetical protein